MNTTHNRSDQSSGSLIGKYFLASLMLLAPLVFSNPSVAASRVFSDDFNGSISGSWQNGDRDPCVSVSSALDGGIGPHTGSGMLRCNWNGKVSWHDPRNFEHIWLPNWSMNRETLIRFWLRPDKDSLDYPAQGPKLFRTGADQNSMCAGDLKGRGISDCNFNDANNRQIADSYWGGGSNIETTAWHKYEYYVNDASSGGIIRIWCDDVLIYEATNINTSQVNGSWNFFGISSNWSGADGCCDHDTSNHIYWDGFEVYSDVGTGAVGSLSDGTISVSELAPPNPPKIQ